MLFARESFSLADIALTLRFAVERDIGLYYARVEGVSWDTSLLPKTPRKPDQWVFLCHVRRGRVMLDPDGEVFESGSTFVAFEHHIATCSPGGRTLRGSKPLLDGVALRMRAAHTPLDCSYPHRLEIDAPVQRALVRSLAVLEDESSDEDALLGEWRSLVDECVASRLLTVRPKLRIGSREHSVVRRAQRALFPILETLMENPMLADAAERVGLTDRQVRRDIVRLQKEFDFLDRGWRSALKRWRVTAAVLLLSSDALTNAEIATAVGYGSLAVMDRAFKRAGLPPPGVVRERHRAAE